MAPELASQPDELVTGLPPEPDDEDGRFESTGRPGEVSDVSRVSSSDAPTGVRQCGQIPPLSFGTTVAPQTRHATMSDIQTIIGIN